jgi:hypothetical protein
LILLYGPAINSAAFKKIAARCSQAMFAQAVLDSNAFAMLAPCDFSAGDRYLRYVYDREAVMFLYRFLISSLPMYKGRQF